jgi:hypothetical protein
MGIRIIGGIRINEGSDRTGAVEAFLEWFWSEHGNNRHSRVYLARSARLIHDNEYLPYLRSKQGKEESRR